MAASVSGKAAMRKRSACDRRVAHVNSHFWSSESLREQQALVLGYRRTSFNLLVQLHPAVLLEGREHVNRFIETDTGRLPEEP